jgi:hypothetical protein
MDGGQMETIIQEILWGKALVEIEDGEGKLVPAIIRSLTGRENNIINHIFKQALREGRESGLFSEDELRRQYATRGIWTKKDEQEIKVLEAGIRRLKRILPDFKNARAKSDTMKARIRRAERDLAKLQQTRAELFASTLEHRAAVIRSRKVAFFTLETIEERLFWTEEEFNNFIDMVFINNVVDSYYEHFVLKTPILREIARSSMWRYRWTSTQNAADLFGCSAADWSEAQNSLIFWSGYYDRIFEHHECPYELINDDEALDAWIERDSKKRRQERKDVSNDRKSNIIRHKNKQTVGGMRETFVMVDEGDNDTIAEIQSENDPLTRARLRQERKVIKSKGRVREWDLRKNQILRGNLRK